jgi:hypothetical protein
MTRVILGACLGALVWCGFVHLIVAERERRLDGGGTMALLNSFALFIVSGILFVALLEAPR